MSQSQSHSETYPRENWWGDATSHDEPDEGDSAAGDNGVGDGPNANPGPGGTWSPDPNDPNEIIAFRLLRDTGTMLCAATLFGDPDRGWGSHLEAEGIQYAPGHDSLAMHHERREVELPDPAARPPTETVRDQRHRVRVNEETGYMTGGHSTAVVLQDRSLSEFIAVLNLWLEGRCQFVPDSIKRDARDLAYRRKRAGDTRDVDVLTEVVAFVREETM